MNRKTIISTLLIARGAFTVGVPAFAEPTGRAESRAADAPSQAQLTMAQAVIIAEAKLNGRVVKAKLAREDAANVYNLKLATAGNEMFHVRIAAAGGNVLSSQKDDDGRARQ